MLEKASEAGSAVTTYAHANSHLFIANGQPPSLTSPPNLPECISYSCRSRREIRIFLISGTLSVYACIPGNVNAMTAVVLASRDAERAAALIRRLGQVEWLELSC